MAHAEAHDGARGSKRSIMHARGASAEWALKETINQIKVASASL